MNNQYYSRYIPTNQKIYNRLNRDFNRFSKYKENYETTKFPAVIRYDAYNSNGHQLSNKSSDSEPPSYRDIDTYKHPTANINESGPSITDDNIPLGLPNSKSYCYMNSVMQSLSHCIEFTNAVLSYRLDSDDHKLDCKNDDSLLVKLFFSLMHDIGYRDKESMMKSSLAFQAIHDRFTEFDNGEQDADEYLQFLLNKLNDITKSKPKKSTEKVNENSEEAFKRFQEDNDSFATRLFCGQMNNELQCSLCKFSKSFLQVFWVLPLPITSNDQDNSEIRLELCLKALLTNEKLDGKSCSKCLNKNSIYTRTKITYWPIYLIIHLKRHILSGHSYKDNTKITWPVNETLGMTANTKYSLLGVIDHIGSTTSGHYVAKFRDLNDRDLWWCLNDLRVSRIEDPAHEVITSNTTTYFFYKLNAPLVE